MTIEDRLRAIRLDPRARVRIENLLKHAEPQYPHPPAGRTVSKLLLAVAAPAGLLSGSADFLASDYGLILSREHSNLSTHRQVCDLLPAQELLPFLAACSQYLRSLPGQQTPVPSGAFEARLNRIFQEHDVHVRLIDGTLSDSDGVLLADSDYEQKFGILLSPKREEAHFKGYAEECAPHHLPIAVLFLDLDNFKGINTKYTESVVDRTILPDAQRLLSSLAMKRGQAYRHGGEEFVLLLPNHNQEEALAIAERIRAAFEQRTFMVDTTSETVTVSIGVALHPKHGAAYQQVLEAANLAERQAKSTGRNRVCVAAGE